LCKLNFWVGGVLGLWGSRFWALGATLLGFFFRVSGSWVYGLLGTALLVVGLLGTAFLVVALLGTDFVLLGLSLLGVWEVPF